MNLVLLVTRRKFYIQWKDRVEKGKNSSSDDMKLEGELNKPYLKLLRSETAARHGGSHL